MNVGLSWALTMPLRIGRRERQVDMLGARPVVGDERARGAEADELHALGRVVAQPDPGERGDRLVERLGRPGVRHADPQVVDPVALARVVDRLDAVAVGVQQEAAVVVLAVPRARSRLPVAAVSGLHAGPPERSDEIVRRHEALQ